MRKEKRNRIARLLMGTILLLGMMILPLSAEEEETRKEFPDLTATGSITVVLVDADGNKLEGGELKLSKVAEVVVDNGFRFQWIDTEEYIDEDADLASMVKEAEGHINENTETAAVSIKNGEVVFSDLAVGLYYIEQTELTENYKQIAPFLVSVPYYTEEFLNEKGEMEAIYDVTVKTKLELERTAKKVEPLITDPPVLKVVTGDDAPTSDEFQFKFTKVTENAPMPVNDDGSLVSETDSEVIIRTYGAGSAEFGVITFTETGSYIYLMSEVNTQRAGYTYDTTVYWYKYVVEQNGDDLVFSNVTVRKSNASGEIVYEAETAPTVKDIEANGFYFENLFKKETPPEEIPHTGQLWWPLPILIVTGIMMTGYGIYRKREE